MEANRLRAVVLEGWTPQDLGAGKVDSVGGVTGGVR